MGSRKQLKETNKTLLKTFVKCSSDRQSIRKLNFTEFEKQFNFSSQMESVLKANVSQQILENIKTIFDKTQNMQVITNAKHNEIQAKFTDLRDKLNNSFEYLQRIKNNIENIKFFYQTKIFEMQHTLMHPDDYLELSNSSQKTKEEVTKQIVEVKNKIQKLQGHIYDENEEHEVVVKSYQEAFDYVTATLKSINNGDYSSFNSVNVK